MPNLNGRFLRGAKGAGDSIAEIIAQAQFELFKQKFEKEVTLKQCVAWMKEMKVKYSSAATCYVYTEAKTNPQTKEEGIAVTLILLDAESNPVKLNQKSAVSTVFLGEAIDEGLISFLNGENKTIVQL